VDTSGTQGYCYNVISSTNAGAIGTNQDCLNVVCQSGYTSASCTSDLNSLSLLSDAFEIFLGAEDDINNYFVILPSTGTTMSHRSLSSYLNYQNIGVCIGRTVDELRSCLSNPGTCDSTVKQCLSYINCQGTYTPATFPSQPQVDFRCLPFYAPTVTDAGKNFLFYAQNIYTNTAVPDNLFVCFQGFLTSTSSFVGCVTINLSFLLPSLRISNSNNIIMFFQGDINAFLNTNLQGNPEFYLSSNTNIMNNIGHFDLNDCLDNLGSTSLGFLDTFISRQLGSSEGFFQEINEKDGECFLIGVKWALGLDTTTDLSSQTEVRKFYIIHIYDLSEEKQKSDDVAYIS